MMSTMTPEEIRLGPLAIRFLVEGAASGGTVAVFEFDVPAERQASGRAQPRRLRGDDLRAPRRHLLDGRGETVEVGPGDVIVHPARGRPPLRQQR